MSRRKEASIIEESFNPYDTIQRLQHSNLVINTIPDEQWVLSVARHKTLLVDVYTLSGTIAHLKRRVTYRSGLLSEVLLRLLRTERRVQRVNFAEKCDEDNIVSLGNRKGKIAETLEEDINVRLQNGDIVFRVIPDEYWRLTNSHFGNYLHTPRHMYYLADEKTLGTPNLKCYRSSKLDHVLLEFLCQKSEFVEHETSKVIAFKQRESEVVQ